MVPENFKENGFMIGIGLFIVAFVIAQSLFFLIKAWKQGKKLGISTEKLKNTVMSSAVFTIAPAISILATVIVLANSLGIVLPWIRLSVIGNLAYESVAAEAALDTFGLTLSSPVTDPKIFATIAFVMTIGCILPLILIIFVMKKVQKTMGKVADKNSKLADTLSAAAFIGIIAAFVARSIADDFHDPAHFPLQKIQDKVARNLRSSDKYVRRDGHCYCHSKGLPRGTCLS